jgi:hypothetical protein
MIAESARIKRFIASSPFASTGFASDRFFFQSDDYPFPVVKVSR